PRPPARGDGRPPARRVRRGGPGHRPARPVRRLRVHAAQPAGGRRAVVRIPHGDGGHGPGGPLRPPRRTGQRIPARTRRRGAAGARHAGLGVLVGAGAGACLGSAALGTGLAVAGRCLGESALTVGRALDRGDLEAARAALPALVGRDPAGMDENEMARAVVESVAENTVDAVVAPAFWAAVGGAPGALGYRAVNTMDAMVGHRSTRYQAYGWASARLDDAAGYLP